MSSLNLKFLIIAVVTISLLLIAGSLLIRTLNPVKIPQLPTLQPTPTVNTSQSTSEPTTIQEAPVPAAIQPAEGISPAQEAASAIAPTSGVEPKGAEAGEPE